MPYILEVDRPKFQDEINTLVTGHKKIEDKENRGHMLMIWILATVKELFDRYTRGELNYFITEVLVNSMELNTAPKYDWANDAIGLLDDVADDLTDYRRRGIIRCVQFELYRRLISVYEDDKIRQNTDIDCYSHL